MSESGMHHAAPLTLGISVPVEGRTRSAVVVAPAGVAPAGGWPLVLAFHGGQSHPEMMRRFSGLDSLAAAGRAVVAFPAGTGSREGLLTWNGGNASTSRPGAGWEAAAGWQSGSGYEMLWARLVNGNPVAYASWTLDASGAHVSGRALTPEQVWDTLSKLPLTFS